jgi:hypothetical protein
VLFLNSKPSKGPKIINYSGIIIIIVIIIIIIIIVNRVLIPGIIHGYVLWNFPRYFEINLEQFIKTLRNVFRNYLSSAGI